MKKNLMKNDNTSKPFKILDTIQKAYEAKSKGGNRSGARERALARKNAGSTGVSTTGPGTAVDGAEDETTAMVRRTSAMIPKKGTKERRELGNYLERELSLPAGTVDRYETDLNVKKEVVGALIMKYGNDFKKLLPGIIKYGEYDEVLAVHDKLLELSQAADIIEIEGPVMAQLEDKKAKLKIEKEANDARVAQEKDNKAKKAKADKVNDDAKKESNRKAKVDKANAGDTMTKEALMAKIEKTFNDNLQSYRWDEPRFGKNSSVWKSGDRSIEITFEDRVSRNDAFRKALGFGTSHLNDICDFGTTLREEDEDKDTFVTYAPRKKYESVIKNVLVRGSDTGDYSGDWADATVAVRFK